MAALKPGEREVALRAKEVTERLALTSSEAFNFYTELGPDGRELTADERSAVQRRLEATALCLHEAHSERDLLAYFADEEDIDFRPIVDVLRMTQRSMVLALSDDSALRARAIPREKLVAYIRPTYEFLAELWNLPDWGELTHRADTQDPD